MPYNVSASAHEVNLLPAKVQTKVIRQELLEFEIVAEDFFIELPVSKQSPLFCGSAVCSDSDPMGASGDPSCREEKGLLQSLLPHHRHWPSLGRTGGVGNMAGKGENKSSNLEDGVTASKLKYFGAILEAVFCPSKQHYRRKKSQQKDEYQPLECPHTCSVMRNLVFLAEHLVPLACLNSIQWDVAAYKFQATYVPIPLGMHMMRFISL